MSIAFITDIIMRIILTINGIPLFRKFLIILCYIIKFYISAT